MSNLEQAKELFLSAMAAFETGNYLEARDQLVDALALAPDRVSILTNLSAVLIKLKQPDDALRHANRSIELEPENAEGWLNSATALHLLGQHDAALEQFNRALAIDPNSAEIWNNLGTTLHDLGRFTEAINAFDRALSIEPASANTWMLRGMSLSDLGHADEALTSYDHAIALNPDHAEAWSNRGNTMHHLNRMDEALASFAKATEIAPDYAYAHFNEACCRLALGDFKNAWPKYHQRRQTETVRDIDIQDLPEWNGLPLAGTLLVKGEQGLGDQILPLSMLREARERCTELVVAVDPRLVSLVQRSFPDCRVISNRETMPTQGISAWISLSDQGRYFRNTWSDFGASKAPWLLVDTGRSNRLRQERDSRLRFRCGLSWVSKNNRFAEHKSLTLETLLPLLRLPGIEFIDLQYGDTRQEREAIKATHGITIRHVEGVDLMNDLEGLAALIDSCDMVVTISNTTAHFAGALGKPMHVILPFSQGRHWYWHHDRSDSPWYPSARLIRQPQPGDWGAAVQQLSQMIAAQYLPQ